MIVEQFVFEKFSGLGLRNRVAKASGVYRIPEQMGGIIATALALPLTLPSLPRRVPPSPRLAGRGRG